MKKFSWKWSLALVAFAILLSAVLPSRKANARRLDGGDAQQITYFASEADLNAFNNPVGTEFFGCGGGHIVRGDTSTYFAKVLTWSCGNPTVPYSCNILSIEYGALSLKPCGADLSWDGSQNCWLSGGSCANCVPYTGGDRVPGVPYCP